MNPVLAGAFLLFVAFLLFYALWGFFLIYHLFRFSPHREMAVVGTVIFLAVTVFILLVTLASYSQIDTAAPLRLPRELFSPQF